MVRPAQVPERDAGVAGVAATPGKAFVIHFELPDSAGAARVSLTEGEEVTVRAPSGAATFTSGAERLLVSNAGSGATFEIGIPRDAPRVEIRVAGGRIFLKDGTRIVSDQPAENQHYVLPLLEP
ncbi:MAG: hypothetical protein H0T90_04475 [Gemmatimonadales bacterium]|nr:hypothetical protein [Gemmatimonadales bacterium]